MAPLAKRRKLLRIEEIIFDPHAREDYLTGFHKRKLQRTKHAQEEAAKKERADRIETRKQLREKRKADLEKHLAEYTTLVKKANQIERGSGSESDLDDEDEDEDDAWENQENGDPVPEDAEYIDEDQYAIVTVEPMDPNGETVKAESDADNELRKGTRNENEKIPKEPSGEQQKNKVWTKTRVKTKKKKFRYESKVERRVVVKMQRAKNNAARNRRSKVDRSK